MFVQVIDFAVDILEIFGIDAVQVRKHGLVSRHFTRKQERAATLVTHLFSAAGTSVGTRSELKPSGSNGRVVAVVHDDVPRLAVIRPIRECSDDV
ncbi:MAG: hypothetical protein ACJ74Z_02035 [Bryobacteraceae bacterium]